jgi:hypothetical protein
VRFLASIHVYYLDSLLTTPISLDSFLITPMTLISLDSVIVHSLLRRSLFSWLELTCLGFHRFWRCAMSWLVLTDGVKFFGEVKCLQAIVHLKTAVLNILCSILFITGGCTALHLHAVSPGQEWVSEKNITKVLLILQLNQTARVSWHHVCVPQTTSVHKDVRRGYNKPHDPDHHGIASGALHNEFRMRFS